MLKSIPTMNFLMRVCDYVIYLKFAFFLFDSQSKKGKNDSSKKVFLFSSAFIIYIIVFIILLYYYIIKKGPEKFFFFSRMSQNFQKRKLCQTFLVFGVLHKMGVSIHLF
jgi:hypothetical protein